MNKTLCCTKIKWNRYLKYFSCIIKLQTRRGHNEDKETTPDAPAQLQGGREWERGAARVSNRAAQLQMCTVHRSASDCEGGEEEGSGSGRTNEF